MSSIDNEILLGAEEDAKEVAFIKAYIGSEIADKYSEVDLYYVLDVLGEYFEHDLKGEPDEDGYVEVDIAETAKYIMKRAKKEEMGPYDKDELALIINAELDYNEAMEG